MIFSRRITNTCSAPNDSIYLLKIQNYILLYELFPHETMRSVLRTLPNIKDGAFTIFAKHSILTIIFEIDLFHIFELIFARSVWPVTNKQQRKTCNRNNFL